MKKIPYFDLKKQYQEIVKRYQLFKTLFPESTYPYSQSICSHVWLPTNIDSNVASVQLEKAGVVVVPSSTFMVGHQDPHFIRVSLTAAKTRQQLKIALSIIKDSHLIKTG